METFRAAHAAAPDWLQAANRCLENLGAQSPQTNIGFLYVTDHLVQVLPQIHDFFREQTGVGHWVGSIGVGICATGQEYLDRPAMCIMTGALPENSFRVFAPVRSEIDEFTREHGEWCANHEAHFAIVHGDARNPRTPGFIAGLADTLDPGFLVGGISSSRAQSLQIADRVVHGGLSGVVLSSDVPIATALTQGCSPIGPVREITDAQDNIAISIDGRPALEVFDEDIGELLARDYAKVAGYIFAGLPIRGSDTGDYLVRNIIGVDARNRMFAIGDNISAGDSIMFCRRDTETAQQDLVRMLKDLKQRAGKPPQAAIYYSCLGRGAHMFGANSEELRIIQKELGEFPLVGFFANGEISNNRLYGFTGVLTLFL